MKFSYSAVSTFEQCPFQYKCRYVDKLKTLPTDDPADALNIGTALHKGIETDVDTAIQEYFDSYPIITDQHVDEEIKLRYLIPKVKEILPNGIHEVQVVDTNFMGTLDLLVPVSDTEFDLYDFKYSNNWMRYMDSRQLHLYMYYWMKKNPGKRIRNMYFVFVPKVQIRQKKTEDLFQFRQRLLKELDKTAVKMEKIQYNPQKVIDHLELTQQIAQCREYTKNPTRLCDWCDYKNYCEKGVKTDMALPKTDRVPADCSQYKKMWIYGAPFSGKTTLCDSAPVPLNLNTDGNVKTVTMARLPIKDTMEGRQKKLAWEIFKEAIDELEAGSDFKTVIVDLLEDTYESCRLFMYKQMGITHESDDSFRAWDKVRTEFLSTFRRLLNLPYNIILISHEDTSKDITKRSGDKITAIRPNIQDKIANKIAGMVDIVLRATKVDDTYLLSTKTSDVVFGGGRLANMKSTEFVSSWDNVEGLYGNTVPDRQNTVVEPEKTTVEETVIKPVKFVTEKEPESKYDIEDVEPQTTTTEPVEEQPKRRTRRVRN
jgi:hypothetical protein